MKILNAFIRFPQSLIFKALRLINAGFLDKMLMWLYNIKCSRYVVTLIIMRPDSILKQIGFNNKEAKIYLSLLELGEANLKQISDLSGIPRTSLYDLMASMLSRGFVDVYKKKNRKIYVAVSPERLLSLSTYNLENFEKNIQAFKELAHSEHRMPKIKFFEGTSGIKIIFKEILKDKKPLLAATSIQDMERIVHESFGNFIKERIEQNLPVKLLTNHSPQSEKLKKKDPEELRQTRFVPRDYSFNTANYIFGNKTAILSLEQKPVIGILIEDSAITKTQRMYFELIWKMASTR